MKKYLSHLTLALVAIFSLSLASCKDKDSKSPNQQEDPQQISIEGTWRSKEKDISVKENVETIFYVRFTGNKLINLVITKPLSGEGEVQIETKEIKFTRSGMTLNAQGEEGKIETVKILKISQTDLTLEVPDPEHPNDPKKNKLELVRVPDAEMNAYLKGK